MERAVRALDTHKAEDIRVLKVTDVTSLADYVDYELGLAGVSPLRTEGYDGANWILMDYAAVVVHVFLPKTRQYYDLERLWQDGTPVDLSDIIIEE